MDGMSSEQWLIFWLANWATAFVYSVIPMRIAQTNILHSSGKGLQKGFIWFIRACGWHHWAHPPAMMFGFWWPAISIDVTMALVSLYAYILLEVYYVKREPDTVSFRSIEWLKYEIFERLDRKWKT